MYQPTYLFIIDITILDEVHYKKLHDMIKWNEKLKKTNKVKIILEVHNY
jgi:hypothetical protein